LESKTLPNEPDPFVEQLKDRVDLMTGDQLVYLFIPEMLAMKDIAESAGEHERCMQIDEVLRYVGSKMELDDFKVFDLGFLKNPELKVPSPQEIIEGKSHKDIPNN
jgi:hypothetical protein